MKQSKINVVVIDTDEKTIYTDNIANRLEAFYGLLKCSTIDIVTRNFGGQLIDIICDDEGLLDPEKRQKPAIITTDKKGENVLEQIVGNCILCAHDEEGESISLTAEQIKAISKCQFRFYNGQLGLIASI